MTWLFWAQCDLMGLGCMPLTKVIVSGTVDLAENDARHCTMIKCMADEACKSASDRSQSGVVDVSFMGDSRQTNGGDQVRTWV